MLIPERFNGSEELLANSLATDWLLQLRLVVTDTQQARNDLMHIAAASAPPFDQLTAELRRRRCGGASCRDVSKPSAKETQRFCFSGSDDALKTDLLTI